MEKKKTELAQFSSHLSRSNQVGVDRIDDNHRIGMYHTSEYLFEFGSLNELVDRSINKPVDSFKPIWMDSPE